MVIPLLAAKECAMPSVVVVVCRRRCLLTPAHIATVPWHYPHSMHGAHRGVMPHGTARDGISARVAQWDP